MNRYDWGRNRPYDQPYARPAHRYGGQFRPRGRAGWPGGPEESWGWNPERLVERSGVPRGRRGRGAYDRGVYGGAYPTYGGYPGDESRGMYYGGRGYDQGYRQPRVPQNLGWTAPARTQATELDDDEIRRAVRENLFNDSYLDAKKIQVEVRDRVVTLRGEVDDYLEVRYAWDDAWEAAGVRGVINQLDVASSPPSQ